MGWPLFSRNRRYDDLAVSIQEHLDERTEELIADGMSEKEASQQARREFGNVTLTAERSREAWQWPRLERKRTSEAGGRRRGSLGMIKRSRDGGLLPGFEEGPGEAFDLPAEHVLEERVFGVRPRGDAVEYGACVVGEGDAWPPLLDKE